jgi:type IV pilus assembly PilN-like protein
MNQQINLYQPMFRKQKIIFSAVTMLQIGIFFLLVFSSLYAYQNSKLKPYQKQIASIETELTQLGNQLAAMESSQKSQSKSKLLENETAKLSKELEQRERISNVLSSRSFGNSSGFSSYLEAFARGHVQGTWLTNINIREGGSSLGLKGKTLSSKLVPVYLQKLAGENSLHGSSFNVMEIARIETDEESSEINFSISTN